MEQLHAQVGQHLDKADQLVVLMLRPVVVPAAPHRDGDRPVGTSGSTSTSKDAAVSIDRKMLEQFGTELQQARTALDRAMGGGQTAEEKR